jgi:hypothetical protein
MPIPSGRLITAFLTHPRQDCDLLQVGTGSFDANGSRTPTEDPIVSYQWNWSGGSATGVSPQPVAFPAGVYVVKLTITTQSGKQFTDKRIIDVARTVDIVSTGSEDGYVTECSSNNNTGCANVSNDGTATALQVGDTASSNLELKSVLSFSTSSLPADAIPLSATVMLVQSASAGSPYPIQMDVTGSTFGTASLENGDFQAAPADVALNSATLTNSAAAYSGVMNSAGAQLIKQQNGRVQVRLHGNVPSNNNGVRDVTQFYSGENGTASQRPVLRVTYWQTG